MINRVLSSKNQQRLRHLQQRLRTPETLNLSQKTPYAILATNEIVQLRYYAPEINSQINLKNKKIPLVIVPPLAVNMAIYDLFPERSFVKYWQKQGYPVYLLDWGNPTREQAAYDFARYVQDFLPRMLSEVRAHAGQTQVILHGWSLGAVLCYAYAAHGDPDIAKMVLLGPPCDYHAKGMQNRHLAKPLHFLEQKFGWTARQTRSEIWHFPGWVNSLGFKLMSPAGTVRGYWELIRHADKLDFVQSHATNGAFLDGMVSYPGKLAQDILYFLITHNVLAQGKLPIENCAYTLSNIKTKVLMIVGNQDPIITPNASRRLMKLMPHAECELIEVPGGHMSIVSGNRAPKEIWTKMAEYLEK